MTYILAMPFLVKVLLSLGIILVLNRVTGRLYLAVAGGTVILALISGHGPASMGHIVFGKGLSPNTLFLMFIIFQVIWLSRQMSDTGVMKDLVDSVNRAVSRRTSMAVLPAVIGLLPMPGGALFSAPLIDACDTENNIDPLTKTEINYWFRHIWEYWWPLYPGVLLAVDLTGLPMLEFIAIQFPLTILSVGAGAFFILRKVEHVRNHGSGKSDALRDTLRHIAPIIIIIASYGLIRAFIPAAAALNKYLPMIAGIALAQVYLQIRRPLPGAVWKNVLLSGKTLQLAVLVFLILIYGAFISAPLPDGSLIMDHMRGELSSWGIPVIFVIMLIPFISGITTGIAVGFVGASFPIVVSLSGGDISQLVLAYGCGYMGMILSPVHVCLVVTAEHFGTDVGTTLRKILYPASAVMAGTVLLHLLYRVMF
ncbi:MAG TPA: DUF401 family protein [Spirochaetota bacterium]|nr:DUF401 family protein [Spirochaetota bacterium]